MIFVDGKNYSYLYTTMKDKYIYTSKELDQGSDLWHEHRFNGLGSSDSYRINGTYNWGTVEELIESKVNQPEDSSSIYSVMGNVLEPLARKYVSSRLEKDKEGNTITYSFEPTCMIHKDPDLSFMRCSLDGWDKEGQVPIEIKCPTVTYFKEILKNGITPSYYTQVQHDLAIINSHYPKVYWMWFAAFQPNHPKVMYKEKVNIDLNFIKELVILERKVWSQITFKRNQLKRKS